MTHVHRINPLVESTADTEKKKEMANHNSLDSVDKCPICSKQMKVLSANSIPSFVCLEHRISFPTKDE